MGLKENFISSKAIAIGSDHAGVKLKSDIIDYLKSNGIASEDYGTYDTTSVDYPDYAKAVATAILSGSSDYGILICGTGIGISISANRFKGIRAGLCCNKEVAKLAREHNDANILVFGARVDGDNFEKIKGMIDIFFTTTFEGGRHERRIKKIDL